jgi:hypothetical protein
MKHHPTRRALFSIPQLFTLIAISLGSYPVWAQEADQAADQQIDNDVVLDAGAGQPQEADDDGSTVVYEAEFFSPYNPITANDMLDRIPGLDLGRGGGGGRGLGTGGNLLINGQRIAGKDNSPRDQLNRITAGEVQRIEIIRNTSGSLNVRGASQVINVVLEAVQSRSSTTVQLVNRLNHDDTFETGGSVAYSRQQGNFQALINVEARPNYENRDNREVQYGPDGAVVGNLFATTIRDQDEYTLSSNLSYSIGSHRMQFNTQLSDGDHPRPIRRDFTEYTDAGPIERLEEERNQNVENDWEIGGDYEYSFANGSSFLMLFVVNDQVRDSVRERFEAEPADTALEKNLFIESNRNTSERIVQGNYSFSLADGQSLRVGLERADTRLDSSLFIGSASGSEPPSDRYGGLPPNLSSSNQGTQVQEIRYEGFAFHNWTLNDRMSLESSLFYETSEISQSGEVSKTRDFQFWRPSVDYRFNITDNFQFRASVERNISQLSFSNFAATADQGDREIDADAGNPELVPQKEWRYQAQLEYRLPNDAGVLNTRFFYADVEDFIGNINATTDPDNPTTATGNVGPSERYGIRMDASTRLGFFNLPDAILSIDVGAFDSSIIDPFLNNEQRTGGRGFAGMDFRHDLTDLRMSYGVEYSYPFYGGEYDIDANTITQEFGQRGVDLFVEKIWFDDVIFRLESDNTLDASRCRLRQRFDGGTINGVLRVTEDSCSSRYRRLTLSIQTTF